MKYNITIFFWLLLTTFLLSSCSTTKNIPNQKLLLTENIVKINGNKKTKENLNPYLIQRPNGKMSLKGYIYNWANPEYEKSWNDRILKYQDSTYFWTKTLSLKQTVAYANFVKKLNELLINNGLAPVILDELKTRKTLRTLYLYYLDQGYFKTKTSYSIDTLSSNKARVIYNIVTDKPFVLDTVKIQIDSPVIDSLYQIHQQKSLIKSGQIFNRDNFEKEADRLTNIFRNAGVYHFSRLSINFREIDSTDINYKTNVVLDISNRIIEEEDSLIEKPYDISYIKEVNVYTDNSYLNQETTQNDKVLYQGINLLANEKLDYKPKFLTQSIFIKPGDKFSDTNLELTRKHLRSLNNFKSIRINYEEKEPHLLTANVFLTPVKRFGFKIETEATHSNINPFGVSGKMSFKNNNTFHGNEIFQISLQGSFLNNANTGGFAFFNAWEMGVDFSLKVPRITLPFAIEKIIPQRMSPKTIYTFGSSLQKNIGLDKQRFTAIMEFDWQSTEKMSHSLELINAQLIKNLNIDSYFKIYSSEYRKLEQIQQTFFPLESLENPIDFLTIAAYNQNFEQSEPEAYKSIINIIYRYEIITENILVPTMSYSFTYNSQSNYKDDNYNFLRIKLSESGLLSSLISKKKQDLPYQLFGTNIAQYFKLDVEFRKHWALKNENILAFRTNLGIALPYGKSNFIPYSRSYFAGGTNDIRAWHIYELGPGSEKSGLEFNVGNFKIISSLEYRYNILNSLKGALFIDAGNIWDILNLRYTTEKAKFVGLSSLKDIAVGSGIGLRYDFSFLVFRADLGFKTYEPYNVEGKKWFQNYNFKHAVFNIGINYPF